MVHGQGKLLGSAVTKVRPRNSMTQWAAGGQNPKGKMTKKQERLMADYLRYLERNRRQ